MILIANAFEIFRILFSFFISIHKFNFQSAEAGTIFNLQSSISNFISKLC